MFETIIITDEIRASFPGETAQLTEGSVYYQLEGPKDGDIVVFVHGMSIPSFIWDPIAELLVEEGFRVLRYDLYGRGLSDRPKMDHTLEAYENQLQELLEALHIFNQKINFVGFSMGAGICASFAVNHPELVKSLCFIEPTHPDDMPAAPLKIFKKVMGLKRFTNSTIQSIISGLSNNFYDYERFPDFQNFFSTQLEHKGFAQAIISTLVDFKFYLLPDIYEKAGKLGFPVCLFWGEEDQLAAFERHETFEALIPQTEFHSVAEAGHLSHYERPDIVNPLLLNFLRTNS